MDISYRIYSYFCRMFSRESGPRWCALVLVCLWLMVPGASAVPERKSRPNILYIMADDLGFNDVSWNNPDVITPNLQKMVDNGVTLNYTYAQPLCTPSRAAYLSGFYPFRIGVQSRVVREGSADFLPLDITILPARLKEAGYSSHLVGKWHLGHCRRDATPINRGFDSFLGLYSGYNGFFTKRKNLFVRIQDFDPNIPGRIYDFFSGNDVYDSPETDYTTDIFTNKTIELIHQLKDYSPFFLALHYTAPHWPLQVPPRYLEYYPNVTNADRRTYLAMVTAMDEGIGKVRKALEDGGLMDNTVVIFVSDNGGDPNFGASNDPLRGRKRTLFEGGTRVPGFVYSPHLIANTPRVSDDLFHMVDWFSTILGIAGVDPGNVDGVNQWDMLSTGVAGTRDTFIYNIFGHNSAIRAGRYKLIEGDLPDFQVRQRPRSSGGDAPLWRQKRSSRRRYKDRRPIEFVRGKKMRRHRRRYRDRRPLESDMDKMMKAFNHLTNVTNIVEDRREGGWTMDSILELMKTYGSEDVTGSYDFRDCHLYDLIEDPSESHDLVKVLPGVVLYLHRLLQLYQAEEVEPVLLVPYQLDPRYESPNNITSNTWCEDRGRKGGHKRPRKGRRGQE